MRDRKIGGSPLTGVPTARDAKPAVGKRTLVEQIAVPPVQRRAAPAGQEAAAPDDLATASAATSAATANDGAGAPMAAPVADHMQRAFGTNFSAVRIHQGPQAAAMGALAYTQGTDIHFAPGQYAPDDARGKQLLGHELAHVVQQSQGRVSATAQAAGLAINNDDALEREADDHGARAARGERVMAAGPWGAPDGAAIQRAVAPVVQMAGDYTGKMPKHEATGVPTYDMNGATKNDYTYHHIIPENYIDEVYEHIKVILNKLDQGQDGTALGGAKNAREGLRAKGTEWGQGVRAKNTAHYLNTGWNLPAQARAQVSEAELLAMFQQTPSTPRDRKNGLLGLLRPKVLQPLRTFVTTLLMSVDNQRLSQTTGPIKDALGRFLSPKDNAELMNADSHNPHDRSTPQLRLTSFRHVIDRVLPTITADMVIEQCLSYGTSWGDKALTAVVKEYALDDAEEDQNEQVKGMALWIPGNIHQGPKSSDRLQGDATYREAGKSRTDPANYDRERDDGGGNFEVSAKHVTSEERFGQLETLKGVLEKLHGMNQQALDSDEGARLVKEMFDSMTKLYAVGTTWFKDVNDKWGYDPAVDKMRINS